VVAWMAVNGVRWEDAVQNHSTRWLVAQSIHLLHLSVSSFFFTLLENYGLWLHHLMPHSLTLVAIFVHFCFMFGACGRRCACSGSSTCYETLGGVQPTSVCTTSSTGPRV
jgi:hypothetical protein